MRHELALQPGGSRQAGFALIYVAFLSVLVTLLLSTSVSYIITSMQAGRHELTKNIQAQNVARAGLQAANFWFAQQAVQPVHQAPDSTNLLWPDKAFYPRYNADPSLSETDNESIGLVRDLPISQDNRLWGHYVIRRQNSNNEPAAGGSVSSNDDYAVHDISNLRTNQPKGSGIIWRVTSYGYVYVRNDYQIGADTVFIMPYNQAPNQIIDKTAAQVELQRLAVNTPVAAITYDQGTLTLGNRSRVMNPTGIAIDYGGTATAPSGITPSPSNVQGNPQVKLDPTLSLSCTSVFSVTENELMGLADQAVKQISELKQPLPTMGILFIDGDATFNSAQQLTGGGILYVTGNLTLAQDGNSSYSGAIYVGGNLTLQGSNYVSGTVIVRGNTTLSATGDYAEADYSDAIMHIVRTRLGTYRSNNLTFKLIPIT